MEQQIFCSLYSLTFAIQVCTLRDQKIFFVLRVRIARVLTSFPWRYQVDVLLLSSWGVYFFPDDLNELLDVVKGREFSQRSEDKIMFGFISCCFQSSVCVCRDELPPEV